MLQYAAASSQTLAVPSPPLWCPPAVTWVSGLSGRLRAPLSMQVLSREGRPGILVQAVSHPGSLTGPGPLQHCSGQAVCVSDVTMQVHAVPLLAA